MATREKKKLLEPLLRTQPLHLALLLLCLFSHLQPSAGGTQEPSGLRLRLRSVQSICLSGFYGNDADSEATASGNKMKLKRFLLRYYPPGIILEYVQGGEVKTKSIDLLFLSAATDVEALVEDIRKAEPLITASRKDQVVNLVLRLQEKLGQQVDHKFYLFKVLRAHILPLTNVAFNKSGSCFITGSYDRTCKLWDTASGEELRSLEGHRNVVYAIAFNNPYGDKIATGSFDKTCKLWSVDTGKCYYTFRGHTAEIVCLSFNLQSTLVATGSMDTTARLWDIQNGEEVVRLTGHSAEIIALSFNTTGDRIITGSFDHTVAVWNVGTGRRMHTLIGHRAEISSAQFNWDCTLIVTGSMDKTCMLWNALSGKRVSTLTGHEDEVLDVCFDYTGQRIATASADGSARVYDAETKKCIAKLEGHGGEISKICFNPQGSCILTASSDKTARLWDPQTGQCIQILEGHTDEIFSCAFNYKGNIIITALCSHLKGTVINLTSSTPEYLAKAFCSHSEAIRSHSIPLCAILKGARIIHVGYGAEDDVWPNRRAAFIR